MNLASRFLAACVALGTFAHVTPARQPAQAASAVGNGAAVLTSDDHRMDWWREARFGMFIHWGIYSVPAGTWNGTVHSGAAEWIMDSAKIPVAEYEPLAARFNPTKFDAAAWVAAAKDAGQKYIVITSKHHDGFCMWGTKETPYNVVDATPFKRDVLKELAAECAKQGVRLGFYYSIMDWHHPDAKGANFPKYVEHMKRQLKELLSGEYGKVAVLWFDGEWIDEWTNELGKDMYAYVRSLQPDIIINNRVGKGRDGMAGLTRDSGAPGDFGTPEQQIPGAPPAGIDWETCMTMNGSWGYHASDNSWKSDSDLVRSLCESASKGGNFLLNVGPTAEGEFPAPCVERLRKIGHWMDANHEAIYGTTASPVRPFYWGDSTAKPGHLYFLVYQWPDDGLLRLRGVFTKFSRATLLATGEEREIIVHPYGTSIKTPPGGRDLAATVVKLDTDGPDDIRPRVIPLLDDNPTIVLSAYDGTITGTKAHLDPSPGLRCLVDWTEPTDVISWDVDFRKAGLYRVAVFGACAGMPGGGEYTIAAGDASTTGSVVYSTGWTNFVRMTPGAIEIKEPGRHTVQMRPSALRGKGPLMNLLGVYLQFHKESAPGKTTPNAKGK